MFSRTGLAVALLFAGIASSNGAEPEVEVVRLAITPASEPIPALKYQLLPKFLDRRPGNAALDYGRAIALHSQSNAADAEFEEDWSKWLELPLAEFREKIKEHDRGRLRQDAKMELLRLAARCEHCDWQLPIREQDFYMILLPELQELRRLARLVAVNVRLDIVDGRYDDAIEHLQIGYAMARHAATQPTLVSGLVGVSIAAMMDRARLDWVQTSGAPSLYWAQVFLPRPLVDLRPSLEAEMYAMMLSFSALRDIRRTSDEWKVEAQKLLLDLPTLMTMAVDDGKQESVWSGVLGYVVIMGKVVARRAELRTFLVRCGYKAAEAEDMSDPQLLLVYTRLKFEQLRDDMIRWTPLPYAEARTHLEAAEEQLRKAKEDGVEIIPLAAAILPAVAQMRHHSAKADRRHDVLQIIEGLRLHAAQHEGELPTSLADATDVPLPRIDAVTGRPFEYVVTGNTARLSLPEEQRGSKKLLIYEITIAK